MYTIGGGKQEIMWWLTKMYISLEAPDKKRVLFTHSRTCSLKASLLQSTISKRWKLHMTLSHFFFVQKKKHLFGCLPHSSNIVTSGHALPMALIQNSKTSKKKRWNLHNWYFIQKINTFLQIQYCILGLLPPSGIIALIQKSYEWKKLWNIYILSLPDLLWIQSFIQKKSKPADLFYHYQFNAVVLKSNHLDQYQCQCSVIVSIAFAPKFPARRANECNCFREGKTMDPPPQ